MTFALHAGAELGIVLPRRDLTISTGGRYRPPAPIPQEMILSYLAEHVLGLPRSY